MAKPKDLTGIRFSSLVAIQPTSKRDSSGSVIWECQCDCGKTAFISSNALRHFNRKDCGCRREARKQLTDRQKEIILAMADCSLNASTVAKKLYMDRSSVTYHISQIEQKAQLDPRNFWDLIKLVEMVKGEQNEQTD